LRSPSWGRAAEIARERRGLKRDTERLSQPIDWASDSQRPSIENVQINHRRADVAMPEQLLHGPDVVAVLKKVSRSGLIYLTPADVHYGRADEVLAGRHQVRLAAYAAHPERFVQGPPRFDILPREVWINPPTKTTGQDAPGTTIVTPDDPRHGVITGPHVILEHQSTALIRTMESLQ
jgi:hypothetical protein